MNNEHTVLFVEDSDSDYELACVGLEQSARPVQARRFATGREFKEYISSSGEPISLFILDLSLPDTSGFHLARDLRQRPDTAHTPVVIFSSSTNPRDKEAASLVGADDFCIKPLHPDQYLKAVAEIVDRWLPRIQPHERP